LNYFRKPLQESLVSLRRDLALVAQNPAGFSASDIKEIQDKVFNKWRV
jgi:hypothetical protein